MHPIATRKYHTVRFSFLGTPLPCILMSHETSFWIWFVDFLCTNKAKRITRQVALIETLISNQKQSFKNNLKAFTYLPWRYQHGFSTCFIDGLWRSSTHIQGAQFNHEAQVELNSKLHYGKAVYDKEPVPKNSSWQVDYGLIVPAAVVCQLVYPIYNKYQHVVVTAFL